MCIELHARGIQFERERSVFVRYRDIAIAGQRVDLIVGACVIVELKAVSRIDAGSEARLISYLRSTGLRLGYLVNFNAPTIKHGLKRMVV
jgi:GxxExxY protein